MPDIDIDFADRQKVLDVVDHIKASRSENNKLVPHNTGIYPHEIPANPISNFSTLDYKEAEERGYFKVDFLNVSLYKEISSEEHLKNLMEAEPLWDLLQQEEFTNLLFHLNGHGAILKKTCPTSVEELAAVLAIIRPAKRHLIGESWTTIMKEVWIPPETGEYYFKKAHAVAYAVAIVVQMNLICEKISYEFS
jgi:DNA polymerase III alpha subunit